MVEPQPDFVDSRFVEYVYIVLHTSTSMYGIVPYHAKALKVTVCQKNNVSPWQLGCQGCSLFYVHNPILSFGWSDALNGIERPPRPCPAGQSGRDSMDRW